jgi:hypothetical protein
VDAVRRVDVLDHLLPRVARGEVEVDVGPLAPLLREEALEEELHLHRVDRGDGEGVADGAVRGRAAPLDEDVLPPAELDDVVDDEEVAGEVELLDEVELALELVLRLRRERLEAGAAPLPTSSAGATRTASRRAGPSRRGSGSRGRRG